MDIATLNIINKLNDEVVCQYRYSECYNCLYTNVTVKENKTIKLGTNWNIDWKILFNDSAQAKTCHSVQMSLYDRMEYDYMIQNRGRPNETFCIINPKKSDTNDFRLPLFVLLTIIFLSYTIYYTIAILYRRRIIQRIGSKLFMYQIDSIEDLGRPDVSSLISEDESSILDTNMITMRNRKKRVKSVDIFRGLSIILMVFVNYGGGGYWFFRHSAWNGLTVADLVFPWFVFVMGISIALTQTRSIRRNKTWQQWLRNWLISCRRAASLFVLGIFLTSAKCEGDLTRLRVMGVLQRLGIAYWFLMTLLSCLNPLMAFCKRKRSSSTQEEVNQEPQLEVNESCTVVCSHAFPEMVISWPYLLVTVGLLVAHGCLSLLKTVPGCGRGYLGPGGIGDKGCCTNCTGGYARWVDVQVLGSTHMYQTPTPRHLYHTKVPNDPEGLLGCLTCTALCIIGYWAGNVILLSKSLRSVMLKLVFGAVFCCAVGVGLCQGQLHSGLIPINKNLWSVSFVMVTSASGLMLLAFLFLVTDAYRFWSGQPLRLAGQNALIIYIGHELLRPYFPVQWSVRQFHIDQLAMACWGVVFWMLVAVFLYRKAIFMTV